MPELLRWPLQSCQFNSQIRRAPRRVGPQTTSVQECALENALRYIDPQDHPQAREEFSHELKEQGRIYGYRFRPQGELKAKPIHEYNGASLAGRAFQLMMDNNLDFRVALYPYELVTYGETGQVCQNWMQWRWIRSYLEKLTNDQTLVLFSGHPVGLFPSHARAPRVILTNGLMVGAYDTPEHFERLSALGVTNYGQMTAGGWFYIGPQGIVHGTYSTLLWAARMRNEKAHNLQGQLFVSSGLGGMSGAQGKAALMARGVALIAEVDQSRIQTRLEQGWITESTSDVRDALAKAQNAQKNGHSCAIAYHGNIVDLLEAAVERKTPISFLSDQTSCHVPYSGGYCPQGMTFEERTHLLARDPLHFRERVNASLQRHFKAIQALVARGSWFFDYGNSFLKAVLDSGCREVAQNGIDEQEGFIFPSYVEDLMGPMLFDYGYGPFRWVCLSGKCEDLAATDKAAAQCIESLRQPMRIQDADNYHWITMAHANQLVVGSQARILYQDAEGRVAIAKRFNQMIREGACGPILLGRDHHDTGGTDSPLRETANIHDGSQWTADMAVHCFVGNAARGMTLVSLHNGGGVGTGKAINGGFALLLDGSHEVDSILEQALEWDVMVGVARRSWAQNPNAREVALAWNQKGKGELSIPARVTPKDVG